MAASLLKSIMIIAFICEWQNIRVAATTRYLPSIVWDRFNKLLTCKCNWMNIPKMAREDRINFVCASEGFVTAPRDDHVSIHKLYYSVFVRPWNLRTHTLQELQQSLGNDSFCDPNHKDTVREQPCQFDDNKQHKFTGRFDTRNDGDLLVYFSNAQSGFKQELNSSTVQCTMVFIVNVSFHEKEVYDMTYGKCAAPKDSKCNNITQQCPCGREDSPNPVRTTPVSSTRRPLSPTTNEPSPTTNEPKPTKQPSKNPTFTEPQKSSKAASTKTITITPAARTSDKKEFDIVPFIIGLFVGIAIAFLLCLAIYVYFRKSGKRTCISNTEESLTNRAKTKDEGFPNRTFTSSTPTKPAPEPHGGNVSASVPLKDVPATNGISPSAKTNEQGMPKRDNPTAI